MVAVREQRKGCYVKDQMTGYQESWARSSGMSEFRGDTPYIRSIVRLLSGCYSRRELQHQRRRLGNTLSSVDHS